jgi:tetratricopeptide (TPR) repeat protein
MYKEAIADFNTALKYDPKNFRALNNRGWILCEMGKYEQSIIDYDKALKLKPNYIKAFLHKGKANVKFKNYLEAMKNFTKVMQLRNVSNFQWQGNQMIEEARHHRNKAWAQQLSHVAKISNKIDINRDYEEFEKFDWNDIQMGERNNNNNNVVRQAPPPPPRPQNNHYGFNVVSLNENIPINLDYLSNQRNYDLSNLPFDELTNNQRRIVFKTVTHMLNLNRLNLRNSN